MVYSQVVYSYAHTNSFTASSDAQLTSGSALGEWERYTLNQVGGIPAEELRADRVHLQMTQLSQASSRTALKVLI